VASSADAANMLTVVQKACRQFVDPTSKGGGAGFDPRSASLMPDALESAGLIVDNGDAQLWREVCRFDNPLPVRRITLSKNDKDEWIVLLPTTGGTIGELGTPAASEPVARAGLLAPEGYPDDAPVGDHLGQITTGIQPGNLSPWCISPILAPEENDEAFARYQEELGRTLPRCPEDAPVATLGSMLQWTYRGAANAGMFVYLYLQALAKGEIQAVPEYDRCEELPKVAAADEEP